MESLAMSRKERTRLEVLSRVKSKQISKVKAATLLGLGYRQVLRSYARYAKAGAAGLTHGLRGKPSNRGHDAAHRAKVLAAYRASYADFGPTLAAEQMLARDALAVDHETLRRLLIGAGLWTRRASASSTAAGATARRTRASWCSSTARRTTGWRGAGRG